MLASFALSVERLVLQEALQPAEVAARLGVPESDVRAAMSMLYVPVPGRTEPAPRLPAEELAELRERTPQKWQKHYTPNRSR